jgi:hypothetical protein
MGFCVTDERYPRVRLYWGAKGRHLALRDCVSICFYTQQPHQDIVQGVICALEVYCHAVGLQALRYYVDDDGDWQELDEAGWEFNRWRMLHPRGANLNLSGSAGEINGYEFIYRGWQPSTPVTPDYPLESSTVLFELPTEYLEAHGPDLVRELAMEMAREIPFDSGHAGLCLHYLPGSKVGVSEAIRDLALRYPGMDIRSDLYSSSKVGHRLNGIHWLTFLGPQVLQPLGGVAGLRSRLYSPGVTVQPLGSERALVTLGPGPEAGDMEQGRTLPHYRELAHVLEPWLLPPYPLTPSP